MVVVNPKNWHWVEKNTLGWSKTYFQDKFIPLRYDHDDYNIEVIELDQISGDSNVSQRKGKVICYFDLKLQFKGQVTSKDNIAEPQNFTVTIPEFMHDDDQFLIQLDTSSLQPDSKNVVSNEFKKYFLNSLLKYQVDLIETHSAEIQE
ncbi:related to Hsp90 co-chaperone HCH1 [Hanseniaspora guilliermondii]|uniref:Related to Hsp90 co-chaperone HCH1 n=1 Tax=Hanseniaspora guilliermondii TaxID=56406 RepID=A0A1L0FID2_9ASCO|nr:related to Hsp90 co-chaperone HCH1 [Hanseniaspora guilliermondii]